MPRPSTSTAKGSGPAPPPRSVKKTPAPVAPVKRVGAARGPYAKTAARRTQILQTALNTFAVRGFRSASLREIAVAAGLTHPAILHHFPSKEALLAEVLLERDMASEPLLEGRMEGLEILGALRDVVAQNETQPDLVRLFTTLSAEATDPSHPAHAYFVARYETVRTVIAGALRAAQERAEIPADIDPVREAATIMALQDGLQVQWLLDPSVGMVEAFEAFLVKFCAALGVDPAIATTPTSTRASA